jgi:putative FmdB family regulatory protein
VPIYEFACGRCGHEFERLVRATGARVPCPSCGARKVVKKFSVFGSKSGGSFTPSKGGGGCTSCSKSSCSSCR